MTATKQAWRTKNGTLYWSEQGRVGCAEHRPYPGSDTWIFEHWQPITPTERIEIASLGQSVRCEVCGSDGR